MQKLYGNYIGLCISNTDPEFRGRVQIFIPHIMPALYERWNKEGKDVAIEVVGNNLQDALAQEDIEQLKLMLPWAEAAAPIFGNSASGHYNPQTGNFNQTYGTESEANAINAGLPGDTYQLTGDPNAPGVIADNVKLTFYSPTQETNDSDTRAGLGNSNNRLQPGIVALSPNLQQQYGLKNGDVVSLTLRDGTKWYGYVGDTTSSRLTNRFDIYLPGGSDGDLANTPGSGQLGTLRLEAAADQRLTGKDLDRLGPELLRQVTGRSAPSGLSINGPAEGILPGSSNPAQHLPQLEVENPTYLDLEPNQQAILDAVADSGFSALPGEPGGFTPSRSGSNLDLALARARKDVGNIYSNGFGGLCHKATRGLVNAAINRPGYFGSGVKGAKLAIGTNYWTKGGYYTRLHPSGSSKAGYRPQEGDIAVTTGGKWGHAKVVLGGRWRSDNLQDNGGNLNLASTEIYRLTDKGAAAWDAGLVGDPSLIGEALPGDPFEDTASVDTDTPGADFAGNVVRHPTSTQPTVTDTTGMPQGLFSVPNPGAMLWVFFREGDPLYPVYFAASYGTKEWQSVYKAGSPGAHYPNAGDSTPRNQAIFRPNQSGGMSFVDTKTDEEDSRSIRIFHANGGHMEWHLHGSVLYSPNEHIQQVGGNAYNSCLNREDWTQGINNSVTIGDKITVVGNASKEALDIIEEHAQIVKDINKNMLKNGGGGGGGSATPGAPRSNASSEDSSPIRSFFGGFADLISGAIRPSTPPAGARQTPPTQQA